MLNQREKRLEKQKGENDPNNAKQRNLHCKQNMQMFVIKSHTDTKMS